MTRLFRALIVAAICACSTPIALAAQRAGVVLGDAVAGARDHGDGDEREHRQARPVPPPVVPAQPSLNRPSFPVQDLNRPSFDINRPLGIDPPAPSPFDARPWTYSPDYSRSHGPRSRGITLGYGFGGYGGFGGFGEPAYADTTARDRRLAARDPEIVSGTLFLDVTPRTAMVFIDTAFAGTADDILFDGVMLSRGRHWLELEAPGYEKKLVEINITPGQPLKYRAELAPVRQAALAVIPPRPPETMYAIPGCYGGNKPPVAATLPPGCDIAKVRVIRPPRPN